MYAHTCDNDSTLTAVVLYSLLIPIHTWSAVYPIDFLSANEVNPFCYSMFPIECLLHSAYGTQLFNLNIYMGIV